MTFFEELKTDVRFEEGLNSCMNCGVCTAICPAADFYNYDPRIIVDIVQCRNEEAIEELLKSETIWYCGECMSCKTRCPRGNTPGLIIMALRALSQKKGLFTESEKGRQQLILKRVIGENILKYGYCVFPANVSYDNHPEQGPVWAWYLKNMPDIVNRLGGNYDKKGPGALRKVSDESLSEIKKIFEVSGGLSFYEDIETASAKKANEMGLKNNNQADDEYCSYVYSHNSNTHNS
jgi:heterodisulfide reductase subunit C1